MVTGQQEPCYSILDPKGHNRRARNRIRSSASTRTDRLLGSSGRVSQRTAFGRLLGLWRRRVLAKVDRDSLAAHTSWRDRGAGLESPDQERFRVFLESDGRARSLLAGAEIF